MISKCSGSTVVYQFVLSTSESQWIVAHRVRKAHHTIHTPRRFHCWIWSQNLESKLNRKVNSHKIQHAESVVTPFKFISDKSKWSQWAVNIGPTDRNLLRQIESHWCECSYTMQFCQLVNNCPAQPRMNEFIPFHLVHNVYSYWWMCVPYKNLICYQYWIFILPAYSSPGSWCRSGQRVWWPGACWASPCSWPTCWPGPGGQSSAASGWRWSLWWHCPWRSWGWKENAEQIRLPQETH